MYSPDGKKDKKIGGLRACARFEVSLDFCVYVTLNLKALVLPSTHELPTL